jgi:hypothetical protein
MVAVTAVLAYVLLDRSPTWHSWLRYAILIGGLGAAAGLAASERAGARVRAAAVGATVAAVLAGPAAYTLNAISTAQTGANPMAGPAVASSGGFPGAGFGGQGFGGERFGSQRFGGQGFAPPASGVNSARGLGDGSSVSQALAAKLKSGAGAYTWIAATSSTQNGASLELATGRSVMAIGGFGGNDPAITLSRFQQLVAQQRIHYYVAGSAFGDPGGPGARGGARGFPAFGPSGPGGLPGQGGGLPAPPSGGFRFGGGPTGGPFGRGNDAANQIQSWVAKHFRSTAVGGTTLYDLTQPKAS